MQLAISTEDQLRKRFHAARLVIDGHNGGEPFPASVIQEVAGVSFKTHCRDIARARQELTFEDWKPKKRGPAAGSRRVGPEVTAMAVKLVYERKGQKRNLAKAARDLCSRALLDGIGLTQPTAKRLVRDVYQRDDPYLRGQEMGREGDRLFELQHGSFTSSSPLEVAFIDHTPLDVKHTLFGDQKRILRPTLTTASDLHSGALLAGFVTLFAPCRTSVALAMAMLTADKSSILRDFGLPGKWECGGIPKVIMVDGAKEFDRAEFDWVCNQYDIDLIVGGGRPELRAPHERIFRTLNSEVHSWPGTTMSNAVELKKHGGMRAVELDFQDIQYRLLIAMMEYNHETYGGSELAPIVAWRNTIGDVPLARRPIGDSRNVFLDFLPSEERDVTRSGITFEGCKYRGAELSALRYGKVKRVRFHYDPRDTDQIYIRVPDERRYVQVPRVEPPDAPRDLYLLRAFNSMKWGAAEQSRDKEILAQLHAAKGRRPSFFDAFGSLDSEPSPARAQFAAGPLPQPLLIPEVREEPIAEPQPSLKPLEIPDFPSRMK